MAGTRAEIKLDDIKKIQSIAGCTVMFAGDNSHARDLIAECNAAIESYSVGADELAITKSEIVAQRGYETTKAIDLRCFSIL
jgi:hypothetical protein